LLLRSKLPIRLGDAGLSGVSVMDEHAIAEDERASRRNRIRPILTPVTGKLFEAERIRGQQTVRTSVPKRGSPQVLRMVEDCDPDILACDPSVIVYPVRALAPDA